MAPSFNRQAFVLMPFSPTKTCKDWNGVFTHVFTPALKKCELKAVRAKQTTGSLITSIVADIAKAWLVLADLTDQNPNVFYELGVRHSLSKRTILLAQGMQHIPSDLRDHWIVLYDTSPSGNAAFGKRLKEIVQDIKANPEKSDNPVSTYLDNEQFGLRSRQTVAVRRRLSCFLAELSGVANTLERIDKDPSYHKLLRMECLNALTTTMYIDLGPLVMTDVYELSHLLLTLREGLSVEKRVVESAKRRTAVVTQHIKDTMQHLESNLFEEPSTVTAMHWKPLPKAESEASIYSKASPK